MLRKARFWIGCVFLVSASFTMLGPVGCADNNNNNNNNNNNQQEDCTDPAFAGCDPGNTCNQTSKKCECDKTECEKLDNSACNPQTSTCDTNCTDDTQCTEAPRTSCKEIGEKKLCVDSTADLCSADADCGDGFKCDTAASPKACVKAGCSTDTECETADASKPACDTTDGQCYECLQDTHCLDGETCNTETKTCESAGCTDTKTCYEGDKTTYCDDADKAAGCKTLTASCDADNKVTKVDNSGWDGSAGIIWNAVAARVTADACWSKKKDNGADVPCTDDVDCDSLGSGVKCFELAGNKYCGTANNNGLAEVKFNFYMPGGLKTGFTEGVVTHASSGIPSDPTSIDSGDKNAGVGRFGVCLDNGGSYQFVARDESGGATNALCYTVAAR